MKRTKSILYAGLLSIVAIFSSCKEGKPTNSPTNGFAKIICEESFRNIMDQEIEVFEFQYPEASVNARYLDEKAAFDSLFNEKVDMIVVTKDLTDQQRELLKAQGRAYRSRRVAVDAIAILVNRDNDVDELSEADLHDIFTGKKRLWGQVSPTKHLKNDSIMLVFDGTATGIVHNITDRFLKGGTFPFQVYAQKNSQDVFRAIQANKNAIGFVGVSWISDDMSARATSIQERVNALNQNDKQPTAVDFKSDLKVRVMKVRGNDQLEGRLPYQYYINDGSYPLIRSIYAIDASAAGTLDHGFFAFLTGVIGQKIILQTGVMPGAEPVRNVQLN